MESRKSFLLLSNRQKLRRVEESMADLEELEVDLDACTHSEKSQTVSDSYSDTEFSSSIYFNETIEKTVSYQLDNSTIEHINNSLIKSDNNISAQIPINLFYNNDRIRIYDYNSFLSFLKMDEDSDVDSNNESDHDESDDFDNDTSDKEFIAAAKQFSLKESFRQRYMKSGRIGRDDMSNFITNFMTSRTL